MSFLKSKQKPIVILLGVSILICCIYIMYQKYYKPDFIIISKNDHEDILITPSKSSASFLTHNDNGNQSWYDFAISPSAAILATLLLLGYFNTSNAKSKITSMLNKELEHPGTYKVSDFPPELQKVANMHIEQTPQQQYLSAEQSIHIIDLPNLQNSAKLQVEQTYPQQYIEDHRSSNIIGDYLYRFKKVSH